MSLPLRGRRTRAVPQLLPKRYRFVKGTNQRLTLILLCLSFTKLENREQENEEYEEGVEEHNDQDDPEGPEDRHPAPRDQIIHLKKNIRCLDQHEES